MIPLGLAGHGLILLFKTPRPSHAAAASTCQERYHQPEKKEKLGSLPAARRPAGGQSVARRSRSRIEHALHWLRPLLEVQTGGLGMAAEPDPPG